MSNAKMQLYTVEYRDWAYGQWFFGASVWARSEADAIESSGLGSKGKDYRAAVARG